MLPLSDIYAYISSNYPQYRMEDKVWQNSVRYTLSQNKKFYKVAKYSKGSGNYWAIKEVTRKSNVKISFKCPECGETFNSEIKLAYHFAMHKMICPECGMAFENKPSLNQHWYLKHIEPLRANTQKSDETASSQNEYKCTRCGSALEQRGNRSYRGTCAKCMMEIQRSSDLDNHVITETDGQPSAGTSKTDHVDCDITEIDVKTEPTDNGETGEAILGP